MRARLGVIAAAASVAAVSSQPSLSPLLARVGEYVEAYERRFSLLVADEHYVQSVEDLSSVVNPTAAAFGRDGSGSAFPKGEGKRQRRTLRSDYLLVALPDGGWIPFRDVYEVDGSPVRDRSDRLAKLFLNDAGLARPDANGFEQARSLMAESTRHNIGDVLRNINLPTLALLFAAAENQPRFTYRVDPAEGGTPVLLFTEQARPTLIRTTNGRDLPVRGRMWIDSDGAVSQTEMIATDAQVSATITTTYERSEALAMRVPVRMTEVYEVRGRATAVSGVATYSLFRRFQVNTTEKVGNHF